MSVSPDSPGVAPSRAQLIAADPAGAAAMFAQAVAATPLDVEARYWLASARLAAGDPAAHAALDEARTLQALLAARDMGVDTARCQSDPDYASATADALYARKLVAMSAVVRRMALAGGRLDGTSLLSYGLALQHQGRLDEACQVFAAASEAAPSPAVDQFQIYPHLLADDGEARHAAAARAWARRHAQGRRAAAAPQSATAPGGHCASATSRPGSPSTSCASSSRRCWSTTIRPRSPSPSIRPTPPARRAVGRPSSISTRSAAWTMRRPPS